MPLHVHKTSPSDLRQVLSQDHQRLDQLFATLLDSFRDGERDAASEAWTRFEDGLRRHIEFETEHILPRFQLHFPQEAAALAHEHEQLLDHLRQLAIGVDLHLTNTDMVSEFVSKLRAHAAREDKLMYVWAQSIADEGWRTRAFTALHDLIVAAREGAR